jgi:hypothetical protein
MVSPHGSCTINNKPGYFITLPAINKILLHKGRNPFISEQHMQIGYLNCMVIVEIFDKERQKPVSIIMQTILLGKYLKQIGDLLGS